MPVLLLLLILVASVLAGLLLDPDQRCWPPASSGRWCSRSPSRCWTSARPTTKTSASGCRGWPSWRSRWRSPGLARGCAAVGHRVDPTRAQRDATRRAARQGLLGLQGSCLQQAPVGCAGAVRHPQPPESAERDRSGHRPAWSGGGLRVPRSRSRWKLAASTPRRWSSACSPPPARGRRPRTPPAPQPPAPRPRVRPGGRGRRRRPAAGRPGPRGWPGRGGRPGPPSGAPTARAPRRASGRTSRLLVADRAGGSP
jgi:hypothetical protein